MSAPTSVPVIHFSMTLMHGEGRSQWYLVSTPINDPDDWHIVTTYVSYGEAKRAWESIPAYLHKPNHNPFVEAQ